MNVISKASSFSVIIHYLIGIAAIINMKPGEQGKERAELKKVIGKVISGL
jgi:uncharacterized membrane protein YuzA (DUF378 family)